jgi:hypothetical protein
MRLISTKQILIALIAGAGIAAPNPDESGKGLIDRATARMCGQFENCDYSEEFRGTVERIRIVTEQDVHVIPIDGTFDIPEEPPHGRRRTEPTRALKINADQVQSLAASLPA